MAFVLLVDPSTHLATEVRALRKPGHVLMHLARADWKSVRRLADMFDVVAAAHLTLGSDPDTLVRSMCGAGFPPLFLLGKGASEIERIAMLKAGAAYCPGEDIGAREFSARISALAARQGQPSDASRPLLIVGNWIIDLERHRVASPGDGFIELTPTEFTVFALLVTSHDRVLTRSHIARRMTGRDRHFDLRTIDAIVSRTRKKLRAAGADDDFDLRSVRNEGYVCMMPVRPQTVWQRHPSPR